jgi:hypothetical protein
MDILLSPKQQPIWMGLYGTLQCIASLLNINLVVHFFIREFIIVMITSHVNKTIFGSCVTWIVGLVIGTNLSVSLYGAL